MLVVDASCLFEVVADTPEVGPTTGAYVVRRTPSGIDERRVAPGERFEG